MASQRATSAVAPRLVCVPIARIARIAAAAVLVVVMIQWLLATPPVAREDLPWTALDLRAPIGLSTARKLAALGDDADRCRALLHQADVRYATVPDRRDGTSCGLNGAVHLTGRTRPATVLACPLAAAVDLWMREVVQPAATDLLGSRVTRIDDFGSYSCRRIRGVSTGWSEHATANAIDVAGFRLADGRRITVARDWGNGMRGVFLQTIRDGACRIFATTLSPDYNALHRDHLHLDEAARGALGGRACD